MVNSAFACLKSMIKYASSQISSLPHSGAPRPHLAPELRVIFQGKYAIYYLASVDEFVVVRVLHASRDIASIAEEGGFTI